MKVDTTSREDIRIGASRLSAVAFFLYIIFFISLICSFRAINSIVIGLIVVVGIVQNKLETGAAFNPRLRLPFFICCSLLFLVHVSALIYTNDRAGQWNSVVLSSGLLFAPMSVCTSNYIFSGTREKLMKLYSILIAAASLTCLIDSVIQYSRTGNKDVFFYHSLVSLFGQHAVYYSILVLIGLIYLIECFLKDQFLFNKPLHISVILFLSLFLLLLSSKLAIVFYVAIIFYYSVLWFRRRIQNGRLIIGLLVSVIIGAVITLSFRNPLSNRFYDAFYGDFKVLQQDSFGPGNYFNAVQFRLLQWKLTGEILKEKNAWLWGVGAATSQQLLDEKYISKHMYAGDPATGTRGYLGYNTHNQFLQTLLESGLPGLLILLTTCFILVRMAWKKKRRILTIIVLLLVIWLFSEAMLGRQFGIVIFTFFPLFLSFD